jgi:hypothetical protein
MNTMRLMIAAAILVGCAFATRTCPAISETNDFFEAPIANCDAWNNCTKAACATAGNTNLTTSLMCLQNTTLTCDQLKTAAMTFVRCLITAAIADQCQPSGTAFGELGLALAGVMSVSEYTGSNVAKSCRLAACKFQNLSGKGDSCLSVFGGENETAVCSYTELNNTNNTPVAPTPRPTPAPASSAASVSTAVLAVLAAVALLL